MAVELPEDVQALAPAVATALRGAVLGREDSGGTREGMIAGAALKACYAYAANPGIDLDVLREAAIRLGGAMLGDRPHVIASKEADPSGTAVELQFAGAATRNLMRSSGASAALSPFKVRRGGTI